jgi:hypothetical protein
VWNGICGESKYVDESVVSEYKSELLEFTSAYEPKNIYIADDTGLFKIEIKAEIVKKCFAKAGFGESDVADNLEEVSVNIAAISNLCQGKELSCDTKEFVRSDDHLATHHSSEPATALLAVRNTQTEDVEDEEEEEKGGEAPAGEQDISTKIRRHEQALHCISEVMQFATYSNSSSLLELSYTIKDCIQKTWKQEVETSFFVGSMEEISMSCIL